MRRVRPCVRPGRLSYRWCILLLVLVCGAALAAPGVYAQVGGDSLDAAVVPVEAVPDSALAARLRGVFTNIDEFEGVQVGVRSGVVRLSGTVLQAEAVEEAADLAGRFEGVLYVDNDLEAERDVETRVTPAIQRVQRFLNQGAELLPLIGIAVLVFLLFWSLSAVIGRWEAPRRIFRVNPLIWGLVRRLLRAALVLMGLLLAFDILGITTLVGAGLGAAGIVGLALGFAFQDIVENYLAGVLLSLRRPFVTNDLVRIGEYEGWVIRLTAREVYLFTFEGNHVLLPNGMVFKSAITNFTQNPRRLFYFDVGIGVEEDLVRAMDVGVATLQAMKGVLEDPAPFARVKQLGDSSVLVRYHGWVDQQHVDFTKAESEAIRLVKAALDEAGVELPEPIYRVHMRQVGGPAEPPAPEAERDASPPRGSPTVAEQAGAVDVAPDGKLNAQVEEDLHRSDDENLLR